MDFPQNGANGYLKEKKYMTNNLIIVFIRNPEIGKVKTRLAKTIGNQSALNIYKHLLNHTEQTLRELDCDKAIFYSEKVNENDIWNANSYQKHQQIGEDLGSRMLHAFKYAFDNKYEKIIIVGSDILDLKPDHISETFLKLESHDVVIGPALDGGYYLLGMKQLQPHIFNNKSWGTATVLEDTLKDLQLLDVYLLEELNDIDTFEDLNNYKLLKELITND
ncbi:TIGR04282 family arsenosugar biosynthesis glycosyltransferase [Formosa maritima]|nr:TIGR04282 family arsenosugar biosynthesis glycosyltransferase [Formosa maritima]